MFTVSFFKGIQNEDASPSGMGYAIILGVLDYHVKKAKSEEEK